MRSQHVLRSRSGPFLLVIAVALVSACDAGVPVAPQEPPEADLLALASATSSGRCYGVQFDLLFTGPVFAGVLVGGDLEGTVDIELLGFTDATGRTNTATFKNTWHITGGVIHELIGESFVTEIANRNLNQIPPSTPFGTAVGTHRVVSGVERANLTYTPGEAKMVSEDPFIFENLLHHRGVICP
jgi:hypothetical protein